MLYLPQNWQLMTNWFYSRLFIRDCRRAEKKKILFLSEIEPRILGRPARGHYEISKHFVEPEGSIPCSQEPTAGSYTEPTQSIPYHFLSLVTTTWRVLRVRMEKTAS
jgi:hypothetical protein